MNDMDMRDRRWFQLSPEDWNTVCAALERPQVFKPHLAALLREDWPWAPERLGKETT